MTAGLGWLWEVGGKGRCELAAETMTLSYPHPVPDKGLCVWDGRAGADVGGGGRGAGVGVLIQSGRGYPGQRQACKVRLSWTESWHIVGTQEIFAH